MISISEQLRITQNQLLECRKNEVKNDMKIDELTERADFYERLHNKEQEKLYESENKCVVLKTALEEKTEHLNRQKQECVALKQEYEDLKQEWDILQCELKEVSVNHIRTVQLFAIIVKRMWHKIAGR